ncbi:class I SAM-dependent methyltransferase [Epilithonimonas hungarica]|uniref:Methyltransferase domain-containing protein n=1 Tax=Epilithonimonas hungarica TaxID=454006 RepID=A0A1G7QX82_9FLAO|nr:class I SAM-dependent methyltransferase [Epilithonimonas hungarica]SDG03136.1 Methyltransferase domain-containing protein [Epilithonimonas hungarica]
MNIEDNYLEINRDSWNTRTEAHINSDFYNLDAFLKGKSSLKDIELNLLGDLTGKSVLHLQCHFGQDSISLSRLGADVVGVDLSNVAIEQAQKFAEQLNAPVQFICCDVYNLPDHFDRQFDIVFTSYGTIGWLPDLDRWAKIISKFLKPGGTFVFVEFHPVIWMFDSAFKKIEYRYFNSGAIIETEKGSYADKEADIEVKTIGWNHSLGEVFSSLIQNGLVITYFEEFDYSPYNNFSHSVESEPGKFRVAHLADKIPMVYALSAIKTNVGQ